MQSNFEKEIYQQPDIIKKLIAEQRPRIEKLARQLRSYSPRFVSIAARGTSDHAAIYAKYLFSGINCIPTGLAIPSLHTLYRSYPDLSGGLVIGISQSGQTPDVRAVMESAQQQGVPTISITNTKDAPISAISDHTILMDVEDEKSVAASKTYTSQLTAVAMLAAYYSEDEQLITDLELLPEYMRAALDQRSAAQAISKSFATKNHAVIVGRGFNHCTTHEIALKIKELSYMIAQPYSAADFRHGPIAILEPGFPVLTIAMRGKALGDMESMIDEIRWTDANLAIMTNVNWLDHYSKNIIRLPEELPDWLSPIACTIPGQMLALHLALERGLDPDKPRRLNKITLTY